MRYSLTLAQSYQDRRIGLLSGASYVVGTIDDALLREVELFAQRKAKWKGGRKLIVINGANGKLVIRFARLDVSGQFLEFKPPLQETNFASLPLLRATAHDPAAFVREHLGNPVRRISKVKKGTRHIGLVIGDEACPYSSLLSIEKDCLVATDVEPRIAGGGGREATVVFAVDDVESERVRAEIKGSMASPRFVADSPFTTNTRLAFARVSPKK